MGGGAAGSSAARFSLAASEYMRSGCACTTSAAVADQPRLTGRERLGEGGGSAASPASGWRSIISTAASRTRRWAECVSSSHADVAVLS